MVNAKCYSIFYEHFSVICYGKQKLCNGKVHVIALHTFIFNPWHLFFLFLSFHHRFKDRYFPNSTIWPIIKGFH